MTGKRSRIESNFEPTQETPKGKRIPRSKSVDSSVPAGNTRSQSKISQSVHTRQETDNQLNKRVEFNPNVNIITEPVPGTSNQLLSTIRSPRIILHKLPISNELVSSSTGNNSLNTKEDISPERLGELQQRLQALEQQEIDRQRGINQVNSSNNDIHSFDDDYIPINPIVDHLIVQIRDIERAETPFIQVDTTREPFCDRKEMAFTAKEISDLIKSYDGEEKALQIYIKNMDTLWNLLGDGAEAADKNRFLIVAQMKLEKKAAEAISSIDNIDSWKKIKDALIAHIKPQHSIERLELKLCTIKQHSNEKLEKYAERVQGLLNDLNDQYDLAQNAVIKTEHDRKARRAFVNGIYDSKLRDRAMAVNSKSLKESIDYTIEQELRIEDANKFTKNLYCNHCKKTNHDERDCRFKKYGGDRNGNKFNQNSNTRKYQNKQYSPPQHNQNNNSDWKQKIVCHKCNKKGHYANECRTDTSSRNNNYQHRNESSRDGENRNNKPNFRADRNFNNNRDQPGTSRNFNYTQINNEDEQVNHLERAIVHQYNSNSEN